MTLALVVMALVATFSGIALALYLYVTNGAVFFGSAALRHPKE